MEEKGSKVDGVRYSPKWDIVRAAINLDVLAQAHRHRDRGAFLTRRSHSVACSVCWRVWVDSFAEVEVDVTE